MTQQTELQKLLTVCIYMYMLYKHLKECIKNWILENYNWIK